jgi:hypothetical protein
MENPKVLPTPISLEVKEEVGQQILNNKITVTIGQLLKLTFNLNMYLIVASKQSTPSEVELPRPHSLLLLLI